MNEAKKSRIIDDLEIRIIKLLESKPMSVAELSSILNISKPSIYLRINRLLSRGIIIKKRIGNKVVFHLSQIPEEKEKIGFEYRIEMKNFFGKAIPYIFIFIGLAIFFYATYSAIEKNIPLRIIGGFIIAFPFLLIALWLREKFKVS